MSAGFNVHLAMICVSRVAISFIAWLGLADYERRGKALPMSSEISIKVDSLSKCYQIYDQPRDRLKQFVVPRLQRAFGQPARQYFHEFWALKGVTFEVQRGETVGIVRHNGSGKSTLLQMICGTLNPSGGGIQTHGRIAALLELGSGFNPGVQRTGKRLYERCGTWAEYGGG